MIIIYEIKISYLCKPNYPLKLTITLMTKNDLTTSWQNKEITKYDIKFHLV